MYIINTIVLCDLIMFSTIYEQPYYLGIYKEKGTLGLSQKKMSFSLLRKDGGQNSGQKPTAQLYMKH